MTKEAPALIVKNWEPSAQNVPLSFLQAFDRAMNHLDKAFGFVDSSHQYISRKVRCTPFAVVMSASWKIQESCYCWTAGPGAQQRPLCH